MATGSIRSGSQIGSPKIASTAPWLSRIVMVPPALIMILTGVRIATSIVSLHSLRMAHTTVIAVMAFILAVRMFGFAEDGTTLAMGDQRVKTIGEFLFLTLNVLGFGVQTYLCKQTVVKP